MGASRGEMYEGNRCVSAGVHVVWWSKGNNRRRWMVTDVYPQGHNADVRNDQRRGEVRPRKGKKGIPTNKKNPCAMGGRPPDARERPHSVGKTLEVERVRFARQRAKASLEDLFDHSRMSSGVQPAQTATSVGGRGVAGCCRMLGAAPICCVFSISRIDL